MHENEIKNILDALENYENRFEEINKTRPNLSELNPCISVDHDSDIEMGMQDRANNKIWDFLCEREVKDYFGYIPEDEVITKDIYYRDRDIIIKREVKDLNLGPIETVFKEEIVLRLDSCLLEKQLHAYIKLLITEMLASSYIEYHEKFF